MDSYNKVRFFIYKENPMDYNVNYPYEWGMSWEDHRDIPSEDKPSTLKLEGVGTLRTSPDVASAFLGVVTENKELSEAQKENSEIMDKVIASLINLGIEEKDIKTESYSISPEYDFVEGKQIFRGYRVNNNLRIIIRDIKQVGKVIDTAVANGANAVYNVNFSLINKEVIYKRALALAIRNAVSKAKSIENTLNVSVDEVPVEIVEESNVDNIPRAELYAIKAPAASTDIRSGELEVTAKVQTVFNYRKI
jgi:uncharacterized protein